MIEAFMLGFWATVGAIAALAVMLVAFAMVFSKGDSE